MLVHRLPCADSSSAPRGVDQETNSGHLWRNSIHCFASPNSNHPILHPFRGVQTRRREPSSPDRSCPQNAGSLAPGFEANKSALISPVSHGEPGLLGSSTFQGKAPKAGELVTPPVPTLELSHSQDGTISPQLQTPLVVPMRQFSWSERAAVDTAGGQCHRPTRPRLRARPGRARLPAALQSSDGEFA
jgi:hypothetical protein